jgi:hypothetical protein
LPGVLVDGCATPFVTGAVLALADAVPAGAASALAMAPGCADATALADEGGVAAVVVGAPCAIAAAVGLWPAEPVTGGVEAPRRTKPPNASAPPSARETAAINLKRGLAGAAIETEGISVPDIPCSLGRGLEMPEVPSGLALVAEASPGAWRADAEDDEALKTVGFAV